MRVNYRSLQIKTRYLNSCFRMFMLLLRLYKAKMWWRRPRRNWAPRMETTHESSRWPRADPKSRGKSPTTISRNGAKITSNGFWSAKKKYSVNKSFFIETKTKKMNKISRTFLLCASLIHWNSKKVWFFGKAEMIYQWLRMVEKRIGVWNTCLSSDDLRSVLDILL